MNFNPLKINNIYKIQFPNSRTVQVFKLIIIHEHNKNNDFLYTFTDNYGNKVQFTNSVFRKVIINEYIEPPTFIKVNTPSINKNPFSLGLPSDNKTFDSTSISIDSYNPHQILKITDEDDLYN